MYIGVLPYHLRSQSPLAAVKLSDIYWMDNNVPAGESVADMRPNDHLIVYPSSTRLLKSFADVHCHIDLLFAEPFSIHKKYYRLIWLLRHKFSLILCRYPDYAKRYNNVLLFNVAETWVNPDQLSTQALHAKTKHCSIIASNKAHLAGHKLRHTLVKFIKEKNLSVDVLGKGYAPFEHKWRGLLPYQYSVVIENIQEPYYFTEKILDAMLCNTIPIYWGTANIGEYFDTEGMIVCNNKDDLQQALINLPTKPSPRMLQASQKNSMVAANYCNLPQRIALAVADYVTQS